MESDVLYLKDLNNPKFERLFTILKENNSMLYSFVVEGLQKNHAAGYRSDDLFFLSNHAEEFGTNQEYLYAVVEVMHNLKVTPEHLQWMNDFLNGNDSVDIGDFIAIFPEAVEKDIPLSTIKSIFEEENDLMTIYQRIVDFDGNSMLESNLSDAHGFENDGEMQNPLMQKEADEIKNITSEPVMEKQISDDSGYSEMFNSLLTVMSMKNAGDDSVKSVSDNLNKIVAKFQLSISELSSYSATIVHEIENNIAEINRLNALLDLQQRVMTGQQNKINSMRSEIVRLNARIQNAEKTEMRREAINQKISELQSLTINERKDDDGVFSFLQN